jgi:hypothetical protein
MVGCMSGAGTEHCEGDEGEMMVVEVKSTKLSLSMLIAY